MRWRIWYVGGGEDHYTEQEGDLVINGGVLVFTRQESRDHPVEIIRIIRDYTQAEPLR